MFGMSYDWGTYHHDKAPSTGSTQNTNQSFWTAGSVSVAGLPTDAKITSITADVYVANRIGQGSAGAGAFWPGNTSVTNKPSGVTIGSGYTDLSSIYDSRRLGVPYAPSNYGGGSSSGTHSMLYNGGGQTTGLMWDPSKSTAKVELISNLQDHNVQRTTRQAWNLRYTAYPAVAQTLLTADSTGCLGFSAKASKDTPQFLIVYGGMPQKSYTNQYPFIVDQIITIKYTSGRKTYTITTHG